MSGKLTDRDTIAAVLVDAVVAGDIKAAERWGFAVRTLQRWRVRLSGDEMLSRMVAEKAEQARSAIAARLDDAMLGAVAFLADSFTRLDPANMEAVHTVAGALKMLAEAKIGLEILSARTRGENRTARPAA